MIKFFSIKGTIVEIRILKRDKNGQITDKTHAKDKVTQVSDKTHA